MINEKLQELYKQKGQIITELELLQNRLQVVNADIVNNLKEKQKISINTRVKNKKE